MTTFIINFHNGITQNIVAADLEELKSIVFDRIPLTNQTLTAHSEAGDLLATCYFDGSKPKHLESSFVYIASGIYAVWVDQEQS